MVSIQGVVDLGRGGRVNEGVRRRGREREGKIHSQRASSFSEINETFRPMEAKVNLQVFMDRGRIIDLIPRVAARKGFIKFPDQKKKKKEKKVGLPGTRASSLRL